MPDAPAPTTTIVAGSSLERPRLLGADHAAAELVPGIGFLTEPVARMTALAASISSPSLLVADAARCPSPVSAPSPSMKSMPFFLNRPQTPPVSVLMTFCAALP